MLFQAYYLKKNDHVSPVIPRVSLSVIGRGARHSVSFDVVEGGTHRFHRYITLQGFPIILVTLWLDILQ